MTVPMLNPLACDTMTDATAFLSARCRESREKVDSGSLKAIRPGRRDRTGRNTDIGDKASLYTLQQPESFPPTYS